MKMQKLLILLSASLIVMLLCSGVALAAPAGNCCMPGAEEGDPCVCGHRGSPEACENSGGIWVGTGNCVYGDIELCKPYCTQFGMCVPEMSTIALLATGLICMVGYLRLRRKEE